MPLGWLNFNNGVIVITLTPNTNNQIIERFESLTRDNQDFWSFKGNSRREQGHGLFQYPAMMVPQMVRTILEQICLVHPNTDSVNDPFAGAGTVLTESMIAGLKFSGADINPLAILLCRVKAGPFFTDELEEKIHQLTSYIDNDLSDSVEVDFINRDKWFRKDVQIGLSKIRRAILREDADWARRFFWIGLAEAVRLTSNSRTSTFKLHIRPISEIETRNNDSIGVFKKAVTRNLQNLKDQAELLKAKGAISQGKYKADIDVTLGDTRQIQQSSQNDVLFTSPPYGDNTSTVPYGQYSYLPLRWIELQDIDPQIDTDFLRSTCEVDARSLGGRKVVKETDFESLADRSDTFKQYIEKLKGQPADRARRVCAFTRDLDGCLDPILRGLCPGGLMIWVLGNRKVGGERVPLDSILADLLVARGATLLWKHSRCIRSKRMAFKNNIAETMSKEAILVMRKAI